jgi:hypothetical protein
VPSDAGVDQRSARLAQGGIALALGVWFAFHLEPIVPVLGVVCALDAALSPRGPLTLLAGLVPGGSGTLGPALPERLTLGLEAALLLVAGALLWGPASRIGALLALATGIVAAVDATSALSPGRWMAARVGSRRRDDAG